ncbi:PREDICTED: ficolin-1-like [Bactrocera latifrons]|uniref:ficolin-1-like n=1 Tax=Bactrocera latifrons TaxID=174628 RepID=UPI0008DE048A|nr:PREDICTED: ficolin-1-like [Bactrocera latifrons]
MFRLTFVILLYCILLFQIRFCYIQDNSNSSKPCACVCDSAVQVGVFEDNLVDENPSTTEQRPVNRPLSCMEATAASNKSGVYKIQIPQLKLPSVDVYCDDDTDGGGWLVFQRRVTYEENFYRDWKNYQNGFGDVSKSFWFGLEKLHVLTSSCEHEMYIKLRKKNGEEYYAKYTKFRIGSESESYALKELGDYNGTAGDSLIRGHLGIKFSAIDRDNDNHGRWHCAYYFRSGWWFHKCYFSNLNGLYLATKKYGINWNSIENEVPLGFSEMMMRPKQSCWRQLMKQSLNRVV